MIINYQSYLYSRPVEGQLISHKDQNAIIREYCTKKKINFPLANTEFNKEGSFFVLKSILSECKGPLSIIVSSINIFKCNKDIIHKILKEFQNKEVVFLFCENDLTLSISDLLVHNYEMEDQCLDFFSKNHLSTKRNYLERMEPSKPHKMRVSKEFSVDYWDGDRCFGYGGYSYDGRWKELASKIIDKYSLSNSSRVLDIGCGKGYLLYELKCILPKLEIVGLDISQYAISNSKIEVRDFLIEHDIKNKTTFKDNYFDLCLSLMTLHNLELPELETAITEINRISKKSYITVESFRNEEELTNLQCWALTCESFFSPRTWRYILEKSGYTGDYELLFFS